MTERANTTLLSKRLWIDGKPVEASSGRQIACVNPATGQVWAHVDEADANDVDRAVEAAARAFPAWRRTEPATRGRLLWRLAELIDRDAERLIRLESTDNGKAVRESGGEIRGAADYLRYYAGLADKVYGQNIDTRRGTVMFTYREPYGVVGAITPWNSPFYMAVRKLAPALAAGNTIVIKPAEHTPVTALELAELTAEAGFPAGLVNVVPGFGEVAGVALTTHPGVRKIVFTGESATGVAITRASADNITPLSFELGGKAPHIVFADADLDAAAISAVNGGYGAAGQSCTAGSRIFVERRACDEFTQRYLELVRSLRVGDPLDPATQVGSITHAEQFGKVSKYVSVGRDEGAEVLVGGDRYNGPPLSLGLFYQPTVFGNTDPGMRIAQDEIFGPVSMIIPFDDDDEVLAASNSVRYGLTAGLWTRDLARAHRFARELEAGMVWVNTFRTVHSSLPYGGFKASGYGREDGIEGLLWYTHTKSVMIDIEPETRPDLFGFRNPA
jgi:aldehyde dehydrogenase (NAD+)